MKNLFRYTFCVLLFLIADIYVFAQGKDTLKSDPNKMKDLKELNSSIESLIGKIEKLENRFDEFDEKHAREVGTTNQVIDRLKEYGVDIIKANPVSYQSDYRSADIVTSFDVIEHFNFPPTEYLSNMLKSLKSLSPKNNSSNCVATVN